MTHLTVPLYVQTLDTALAGAARAAEHGADLVEFRIDAFADPATGPPHPPHTGPAGPAGIAEALGELVLRSALPCLVTARTQHEGGRFPGDAGGDEAYRALIDTLAGLPVPPAYIDVELARVQHDPQLDALLRDLAKRENTPGFIFSTHDFATRPADLDRRIAAMAEHPACRAIKAAWRARSLRDNVEAFELIARKLKPTVALCMGEYGLPSRVLAKKFGAFLTFAALDTDAGTAPGQPTLNELKTLYRWDAITPATRVFGVIGHPVAHSMSPAIHNAGFDALADNAHTDTAPPFDGVYLPLPIPPQYEHFKATVLAWLDFKPLHFRGASVTLPHKANLLRLIEEQAGDLEPLAVQIGAANTLAVKNDGTLCASNTDYAAVLDAVCGVMGTERAGLRGRRIAVLGAGGVSRAIVAGFRDAGCEVCIFNRTLSRAEELASVFGASAATLADAAAHTADIWVNGTSLGMHPDVAATPLPAVPASWNADTVVFDTIYNPVDTKLLADAQRAGCRTLSGVDMFVLQGAAQFQRWTGCAAPRDVFRRVMLEKLQPPA